MRTSPLFLRNFQSTFLVLFIFCIFRTGEQYSNSLDGALRTAHSLLDLSPSRSHAPLSVCACHCYSAGDIKVLEKCTQLTSVNFMGCQRVTGESSGGRFLSELRTSPLFLWNFPFFGVTDSALPTLFSTSLPRGLMPLSPFVLATATPQATSRRSRSARS